VDKQNTVHPTVDGQESTVHVIMDIVIHDVKRGLVVPPMIVVVNIINASVVSVCVMHPQHRELDVMEEQYHLKVMYMGVVIRQCHSTHGHPVVLLYGC